MTISGFDIVMPVAESKKFLLFLARQKDSGNQCLIQQAAAVEFNPILDRTAFILNTLRQQALEIDADALAKGDAEKLFNYGIQFPQVADSFVSDDNAGKRINVLSFQGISDITKLIPLINITNKDRRRVDLRSSAWIMGKMLRLFVFSHSLGISLNNLSGSRILLETDDHYVTILDWSAAQLHAGQIPLQARRNDIAKAAQAVIVALGGDVSTGVIPNDGDEAYDRYTQYLLRLSRGGESKAERAHQKFYEIVDAYWRREYYAFTTKQL